MFKCLTTIESFKRVSRVECKPMALETRRIFSNEDCDIVYSAWKHAAALMWKSKRNSLLRVSLNKMSCDMFLGVPFNIANSALLLSMVAAATGYTPRTFTHFLTDAHIYVNHVDQVHEVLGNTPLPLPKLVLPEISKTCTADELAAINPKLILLEGYQSAGYIPGEMSTG